MTSISINHLLVAGVGLIGGSLALALKRAGAVSRVTGFGRRPQNLDQAVELGVIDDYVLDLGGSAVQSADVVFLGVPVGAMSPILSDLAPVVREDAVITDGGSTKGGPIAAAQKCLGTRFGRFVAGHPIAGSERSGVAAARADLFDHHKVLLTPVNETEPESVA
ncbi:MAG: prephenate dehydrogenase/arogenate dehydrogenase family protein, partial [Proteobacteria bacterium]